MSLCAAPRGGVPLRGCARPACARARRPHPARSRVGWRVATALSAAPSPSLQHVDLSCLCACTAEVRRDWTPAKVDKVVQSGPSTVDVAVRTGLRRGWLRVCWDAGGGARLSLAARPPPKGAGAGAAFGGALDAALKGKVLLSAQLDRPWDRVAVLSFGAAPGGDPTVAVLVEVMGRYSNAYLLDVSPEGGGGGRKVVAAAFQVTSAMSRARQLRTGAPYEAPPLARGLPPDARAVAEESSWRNTVERMAREPRGGGRDRGLHAGQPGAGDRVTRDQVREALVTCFHGVSPALARELVEHACSGGGTGTVASVPDTASFTDAHWAELWAAFRGWVERCVSGDGFTMGAGAPADGTYSVLGLLGPYRSPRTKGEGEASALAHSPESVLEMVEDYYEGMQGHVGGVARGREGTGGMGGGRARCEALARDAARLRRRAQRLVAKFEAQVSAAKGAAAETHVGDVLLAAQADLGESPLGVDRVTVPDFDAGNNSASCGVLDIAVDPLKTAVENAVAYYERGGKLRRSLDHVVPLLESAQRWEAGLAEVTVSLDLLMDTPEWNAQDASVLAEIAAELDGLREGGVRPPGVSLNSKTIGASPRSSKANKKGSKGAAAGTSAKKGTGVGGGNGKGKGASAASDFLRFTSPGGLEVLVGRNSRQNDRLTFATAAKGDVWLHARGVPGSHCVLRTASAGCEASAEGLLAAARKDGGLETSKERAARMDPDLRFAADLAARHSQGGRGQAVVPVSILRASDVRRAPGGVPGAVLMNGPEAVVYGRPEDAPPLPAALGGTP